MGLAPVVIPALIDEQSIPWSDPEQYVRDLALKKAMAVSAQHPDYFVIGADTIVLCDNTVLGKPASKEQAVEMLNTLSGRMHSVHTGIAVIQDSNNLVAQQSVKTDVYFKPLTRDEINWYAGTNEPYDKAGAYGIQGKGAFMVKRIKGSYSNVVGLPVCELFQVFIDHNIVELTGTLP